MRRPGAWRSLAYLLTTGPLAFVTFGVLLLGTGLGIVSTVVWVGIPLLMLLTLCWRGVARMERGWLRVTLGVGIPTPYRPLPDGSVFRRWRAMLADPATWRDVAYVLLRGPLAITTFAVVVVLWAFGLTFMSLPIWVRLLRGDGVSVPDLHGKTVQLHTASEALPYAAAGVVPVVVAILLTPLLVRMQAALARALLGPTKASRLEVRADRLQASRARGVDAAELERRRIERDLHDGAQQRLVAVAMTLGRARTKLDSDPESVRALIDEAHADAKQAVAELRDLARGIYPAVLGDRGLDAALSALAARSPVPLSVEVDVDPRPPTAVESTAYFIVAEALTNMAKHAGAQTARVFVRRDADMVTVQFIDDGRGGAVLRPGGGLAGLADRAATIDGMVKVFSPPGGPTIVTAELPCVW